MKYSLTILGMFEFSLYEGVKPNICRIQTLKDVREW